GATAQTGSTARQNSTARTARQARARGSSSQAAGQPAEITLSGCLEASDRSRAGAPTAAQRATSTRRAQANQEPTFVLANANQGSGESGAPPQSVGTAGTAGASAGGSYILLGLDLSRQIGQQVEVTGTMMPAPGARSARSRATGTLGSTSETS